MAEQNNGYPMISEKNWWTIREKFKASLPSSVSPNYVKTLLTMSSDNSANSNVIYPMRRLGLIDEDNKPTPLANEWRLDDKYKDACESMVKRVYDAELLDLFPDSTVDRVVARNWFMSRGVGQAAADKMVALFVLLKSAEIKNTKNSPQRKVATATKSDSKHQKNAERVAEEREVSTKNGKNDLISSQNRPNLHIDLQIHISPESTPEQIEAIFASMAKHLYGVEK